ncbi:MAG: trypsin-like peptidase domain-containing protein [Bacteroidetes bacterium]|nr:trypsin-like peptidase domain-containing protein [Bacteroidota bacterium]
MKRFVGILLIAMLGGAVTLGLSKIIEKKELPVQYSYSPGVGVPVHTASYNPSAGFNLPDFETAASVSVPAVVHIKTEFHRKSGVYNDWFDFFNFGNPVPDERMTPITAMGSGVIINSEGFIVTNNHVVQDADKINVTLNDKRIYIATIVGADPSTDLAVIRIEEKNLPFLTFGNSDEVKVGEWVLAVGNPFNLTSTVTAGIVSAKARDINILGSQGAIESFIQTDAAVNPGNSGGALVNTKGELIGINAAIASGTGSYVGYSFAIPSNIVRKVVDDFIKTGKVDRAYLGIYYKEIDAQFAKDQGLPDINGVYVQELVEGGAAALAGIKKGDVVVRLNNMPINSKSELLEVVAQHSPGDKLNVQVEREGKTIDFPLTLQSENKIVATNTSVIIQDATFQRITQKEKSRLHIDDGFQIIHLDNGLFRKAGIREGFIVTAIDRQPIHTAHDLKEALTSKSGGILIEGVYPSGLRVYYGIGN